MSVNSEKNKLKEEISKKTAGRHGVGLKRKLYKLLISNLRLYGARRFLSKNRSIFSPIKNTDKDSPVVLVEVQPMNIHHISFSYFANVLAKKNNARLIGYIIVPQGKPILKIKAYIEKFLSLFPIFVYRSFGVKDFIFPEPNSKDSVKVAEIYQSILTQLKTKSDIENITINGILIGDLIYDSYLREFNKPTIDIGSDEFFGHLWKTIGIFLYWRGYFNRHKVCSVLVSHSVYLMGIPVRIAAHNDISVYEVTPNRCLYLDKQHLHGFMAHLDFPKKFSKMPKEVRQQGIESAKNAIEKRFLGEKNSDMLNAGSSLYSKKLYKDSRLIRASGKAKVLIFSHCFFDAPHPFGNNIFPDFYEWLCFLGKVSEKTDYDWYIKAHPDELPGNVDIMLGFLSQYPNIKLLPVDASHHQVIDEGVNVVLTVYGTVGFEYAALGVPVINCSVNNPHFQYDFNLNPKNVEEYTELLFSLDDIKIDINIDQVYEYYFMKSLYDDPNIIFDYDNIPNRIEIQYMPKMYNYWNRWLSTERHNAVLDAVEYFIDSKEYRMRSLATLDFENRMSS